jgi:hypothetical protein
LLLGILIVACKCAVLTLAVEQILLAGTTAHQYSCSHQRKQKNLISHHFVKVYVKHLTFLLIDEQNRYFVASCYLFLTKKAMDY